MHELGNGNTLLTNLQLKRKLYNLTHDIPPNLYFSTVVDTNNYPNVVHDTPIYLLSRAIYSYLYDSLYIPLSTEITKSETHELRIKFIDLFIDYYEEEQINIQNKYNKAMQLLKQPTETNEIELSTVSQHIIPQNIMIGLQLMIQFLVQIIDTQPELCYQPLEYIAKTFQYWSPQNILSEIQPSSSSPSSSSLVLSINLWKTIENLLIKFIRLPNNNPYSDTIHTIKGMAINGLISLSLAQGTLSSVISTINELVSTASFTVKPSSSLTTTNVHSNIHQPVEKNTNNYPVQIPEILQTMNRMATSTAPLPLFQLDKLSLLEKNIIQFELPYLSRNSLLSSSPTVVIPSFTTDNKYIYLYHPYTYQIYAIGTGYQSTELNKIYDQLDLQLWVQTIINQNNSADTNNISINYPKITLHIIYSESAIVHPNKIVPNNFGNDNKFNTFEPIN